MIVLHIIEKIRDIQPKLLHYYAGLNYGVVGIEYLNDSISDRVIEELIKCLPWVKFLRYSIPMLLSKLLMVSYFSKIITPVLISISM